MNVLDRILNAIRGPLKAQIEGITGEAIADEPAQRAINVDVLYGQIYEWAYEQWPGMYLAQLYIEDDGTLYALFSRDARLYRAPVTISSGTIQIGEMVEVQQEFTPVSRSGFTMRELPNGDVRFFLVAATAVVNRVGEIDSTTLFDNMIRRAEELDFYPRVDLYHLGSKDSAFEFGQIDFLARDGVCYVASGVLDGNHPLTQECLKRHKENPASIGASIEYFPIVGAFEDFEVGGATIRAFLDGINTRISILFEQDAASWFTSMRTGDFAMQQRQLDDAQKAKLRQFFGGNEDALGAFLGNIEGITRTVADAGLITRGADAATGEGEPEVPADDLPESAIEIDEETIKLIATEVVRQLGDGALKTVTESITALSATTKKLQNDVTALSGTQRAISDRLANVEATDEVKRQQWVGDLPRGQRTVTVSHRPRVERQAEQKDPTSDDVAEATLAGIPDPTRRSK